jgi:hypothetical protein
MNARNDTESLDELLKRAARDPEFRKVFFSNSQQVLKDWGFPIEIRTLIGKCFTEINKDLQ